jgi:hypothetical protein
MYRRLSEAFLQLKAEGGIRRSTAPSDIGSRSV